MENADWVFIPQVGFFWAEDRQSANARTKIKLHRFSSRESFSSKQNSFPLAPLHKRTHLQLGDYVYSYNLFQKTAHIN